MMRGFLGASFPSMKVSGSIPTREKLAVPTCRVEHPGYAYPSGAFCCSHKMPESHARHLRLEPASLRSGSRDLTDPSQWRGGRRHTEFGGGRLCSSVGH